MNILITGGAGNLGSHLVVPLVRRGDRVTLFDLRREPLADSEEFHQSTFIEGDLGDWNGVWDAVRSQQIETIFHLGAVLSADAEERSEAAWRGNLEGTRNVFMAAHKAGVRRVVFSSTMASYGPGLPEPLSLDAPQWPLTLYGATKVAGERLGVYYHHRFGLDFRGIRLPAVAAARGAPGGISGYCAAVFEESVRNGRYDFFLNPTTRCPMIYIADAIQALLLLHDAPQKNLRHRIYNIGAFGPSAEELAAAVRKQLPEVQITYHPDPIRTPIVESWPSQVDDSDAREDWSWKATYDLDQMASEIIEALRRDLQEE